MASVVKSVFMLRCIILPFTEIEIPQPTRIQVLVSPTTVTEQPTVQPTATPTTIAVSNTALANALRITIPEYTEENVRRIIDVLALCIHITEWEGRQKKNHHANANVHPHFICNAF